MKFTPENIMKAILVGLAGVVILGGLATCFPAQAGETPSGTLPLSSATTDDDMKYLQMFTPTVQIGDFCSGAIVQSSRDLETGTAKTVIMTAKHCVPESELPVVRIHNYDKNRHVSVTSFNVKKVDKCWKSDVAFLELKDADTYLGPSVVFPTAEDIRAFKFGDPVHLVGFPAGKSKTYTVGNIGYVEEIPAFSEYSTSKEFYRASPDLTGGSSGSSLFWKDRMGNYKVMGVTTGQFRGLTFFNYFTPPEEVLECLSSAKIEPSDWFRK